MAPGALGGRCLLARPIDPMDTAACSEVRNDKAPLALMRPYVLNVLINLSRVPGVSDQHHCLRHSLAVDHVLAHCPHDAGESNRVRVRRAPCHSDCNARAGGDLISWNDADDLSAPHRALTHAFRPQHPLNKLTIGTFSEQALKAAHYRGNNVLYIAGLGEVVIAVTGDAGSNATHDLSINVASFSASGFQ